MWLNGKAIDEYGSGSTTSFLRKMRTNARQSNTRKQSTAMLQRLRGIFEEMAEIDRTYCPPREQLVAGARQRWQDRKAANRSDPQPRGETC